MKAPWILAVTLVALGPSTQEPTSPRPDSIEAARTPAPASVRAKLAQAPQPFDAPDAAQDYHRAKRLGGARGIDPAAAYRAAREAMAEMPRYSTRRRDFVARSAGASIAGAAALDAWSPLGPGNIGGRTRTLVIDPKRPRTMYTGGVSGGVWKTRNGGKRWRPLGDEMANLAVNALAIDPDNRKVLYAGTGEGFFREEVRGTGLPLRGGGIFKTEDGGATWRQLEATRGGAFLWVNDIVASPRDGSRLYAATRNGVFRSTDGGESWKRVLRARVRGGCLDLALRTDRPTDVLFASCGTFKQATVYRNAAAENDGGWEPVLSDPGMGRTSLAIAPSDQSVVYALAASNLPGPGGRFEQALHAVFRSGDSGVAGSWEARLRNSDPRRLDTLLLSNPIIAFLEECGFRGPNEYFAMGWYVNVIAVDPSDPDRVWAAGVDLFRSDDGGRQWSPASFWWDESTSNFVHADQHALVFHPRKKQTLYALNDGGVFRSTNAAAPVANGPQGGVCSPGSSAVRWRSLNNSLGITQFYHGSVFPGGSSFIGGAQDNGTLIGVAGNERWVEIFGGDGGYSAIDPEDPRNLYVTFQGGEIRKSVDGGFNFGPATSGITDLLPDAPSDFRAVPPNFLFISPLVMDPDDPRRLWSGGRRLWRTDDGATNWSAASTALIGGDKASAIAVAPGRSERVLVGADGGRIYRTDDALTADAGSDWQDTLPRRGWVSWLAFEPGDPDVAYATYAGFGGRHVWKTTDGGASWRSIDGAGAGRLPDIPAHALAIDPGDPRRLYLATDLGVFVSLDGGGAWAVENAGFANAVTESLALSIGGSRTWLYAFTHGRGAWRVPLD